MKRPVLMAALLIAITMLTACGGKDDTAAQNKAAAQQAANGAQAEAAQVVVKPESADESRPVDLDLSKISGTVVYSQVYDMMAQPQNYMGQIVRVKGNFSYYQDPETKREYFAAVIADATACCAQGIEFVWKGEHRYPRDYPPLDTEITVTGTFNTYFEGENMYVQLLDADASW